MSSEMGGKYETITGHLVLILDRKKKKQYDKVIEYSGCLCNGSFTVTSFQENCYFQ
jgi:hypothetical protein